MRPNECYQQDLSFNGMLPDPAQAEAVALLDDLYQKIVQQIESSQHFTFRLGLKKLPRTQGLYFWGGVGIGKTYIMDLFYKCLPEENKQRMHFHVFMQMVHSELTRLQGEKNPIEVFVKQFAKTCRVLCFDEVVVNDIADAMLLAGLFKALFQQGVILVATSNIHPQDLYKNGLQRRSFLPAIDLLKENMQIFNLQAKQDYRLRYLTEAGVYFNASESTAELEMQRLFSHLLPYGEVQAQPITIAGRDIMTKRYGTHVIWFEFDVLCNVPRSQQDYIAIAQQYHTLLLSNVPRIYPNQDNIITYFINLIDVLYDFKVKLIMSSHGSIDGIYTQGRKTFEFERTKSRLQEMQSKEYLAIAHHLVSDSSDIKE